MSANARVRTHDNEWSLAPILRQILVRKQDPQHVKPALVTYSLTERVAASDEFDAALLAEASAFNP
ncbi:MAG: hypothetical protein AAF989_05560 [Planctomycetota bacterium]